ARSELWLAENQEAIESSNAYVEKHGLPLAKHRMF
ncbi:MAG: type II toxin-antitoxin system CcdA family antitoxin, partial [Burkholderiaceae bacterium]